MKIVYITHPISGDVALNLEKVRLIVRQINLDEPDVVPFAPYWLDCHALNDNVSEERQRGIKNDSAFFDKDIIDELRLYGDKISSGMIQEIQKALEYGIPIVPMTPMTTRSFKVLFEHQVAFDFPEIL